MRGGVGCRRLFGKFVVVLSWIRRVLLVVEQVKCYVLACDITRASIAIYLSPSLGAAGGEVISLDMTARTGRS